MRPPNPSAFAFPRQLVFFLVMVLSLLLVASAWAGSADPSVEAAAQSAQPLPDSDSLDGQQVAKKKKRRKKKRRRKRRRGKSEPPPEVESEPAVESVPDEGTDEGAGVASVDAEADPAAEGGGGVASVGLQRGNRMEFDGRLVRGETAGSGAVFLFERAPRPLPSMVKLRTSYVDETVYEVLGEAPEDDESDGDGDAAEKGSGADKEKKVTRKNRRKRRKKRRKR